VDPDAIGLLVLAVASAGIVIRLVGQRRGSRRLMRAGSAVVVAVLAGLVLLVAWPLADGGPLLP
jgi:hypothetical protein